MAVVFNGVTRQIEITDNTIFTLDVERDLYSAWKRWQQDDPKNAGYAPAFFSFGGNGTAPGQTAPKYFFLQNFWQVKIDNGNVVSVGLNLYTEDYLTPYVIETGSGVSDRNSDAVSVNSQDIEFASFNGGVTVDTGNVTGRAVAGTAFPIGTERAPVTNLADAKLIAASRGFNKIYIKGNLTIDNSVDFEGFEFLGDSATKTNIVIDTSANVLNCEFFDASISGVLDGNSRIESCIVSNLDVIDGFIYKTALGPGTCTLGTSLISNMFSCYSTIPGATSPIIDMNATGVLALRDYNGGVELRNYSGSDSHSIDLASGQIKLDPATITSGTFVVRGVGKLIDASTGALIQSGTWNSGVTIVNETSSVADDKIRELHQMDGLDDANPVSITPTQKTSGTIDVTIGGDGENIATLTRQ